MKKNSKPNFFTEKEDTPQNSQTNQTPSHQNTSEKGQKPTLVNIDCSNKKKEFNFTPGKCTIS